MENREYITSLFEIYKNLLTDREIEYFENYYYEDLSLQEIADNFEVSKSYVGKFINNISDKLIKFEESLNILERNNKIKSIISKCDDRIRSEIESLL